MGMDLKGLEKKKGVENDIFWCEIGSGQDLKIRVAHPYLEFP